MIHEQAAERAGVDIAQGIRAGNSFERVQLGAFSVVSNANEFFVNRGFWPAVENILNPVGLYSLPVSEADEVLRILYGHGITRHHLMPSLDNAARASEYALKLFPRIRRENVLLLPNHPR